MTFKFRVFALSVAVIGVVGGASFFYMTQAGAENAASTAPAAGQPATGKPLKDAIKANAVYATFDGGKLTGKDIMAFVNTMPPQMQTAPAENLLELVVNQVVNNRLIDQAVAEQKLANDKVAKERIAEATEQVLRTRFVEKSIEGKVSDADLKKKYDELIAKVPDENEMRARHILVSDEKTAKDIIAKLGKGGDFAKLAEEHSTDATKANGGDLGYFPRGMMIKEFDEAVFAMKKGEVSKTPIKTQFGWHVIKVEDVRKRPKPEFNQVKERLRAQMNEEQLRKVIEGLREKAKVQITLPQS